MKIFFFLVPLLIPIFISSCSSAPRTEYYKFEFNSITESRGIEILDYRYGDNLLTRAAPWQINKPGSIKGSGITAPLQRGDYLYVKWQIVETGQLVEKTVDLRRRLPASLENHVIHFVVEADKLFVFLISPEKTIVGPCLNRKDIREVKRTGTAYDKVFWKYCDQKIVQIYPDE